MVNIDFEPYRAMAQAGPLAVAQEAKRRGLNPVEGILVLRRVYGMSIGDAKTVVPHVWQGNWEGEGSETKAGQDS